MNQKTYFNMTSLISLFILLQTFTACNDPQDEPTILQLDVSSIDFPMTGGENTFQITCEEAWSITGTKEWLSLSAISGEGDAEITVSVNSNEVPEARSATLVVSSGEGSANVKISQEAYRYTDANGFSYDLPPDSTDMRLLTSNELAGLMGKGWNMGNSLEAIGGETEWGNPLITQQLVDSVKAAGFNAIRLPVAWSVFENEENFIIDPDWIERVEEVVNYILNNDMYVVMNIHWDGGWMQPTYDDQAYVNKRLAAMWEQIAVYFRDYNDHLLFAGTNEVMVEGDYGTPTAEYYTVQNSFNQTFITTVRTTGGRNARRHLVVQGFNTNIDHTVNFAVIPEDPTEDRMMMEVHYYDPYNFALNENSNISQWGEIATDPALTETWANESFADGQFQKMKTNFVDKGIAVIIGEYGAISRLDVEGHEVFLNYYLEYITNSMLEHDCVPFYWDNGHTGNHGFGLFNRSSGAQVFPELIEAICGSEK